MPLNIKKILVPIDFSDTSMSALNYAAFIARKVQAEITLLHIIESYEFNAVIKSNKAMSDIIVKGVKVKLEEIILKENILKDIKVKMSYKEGKIYREIDEMALKGSFDLIVMGTHGVSGIKDIKRAMLGTNSYRVVHSSPCAVLTVRKGRRYPKFKDILLPLDITKETKQKVNLAIEWARLFDSTIHVVSVSRFIDEFIVDISKLKFQLREVAAKIKDAKVETTTKMIRHNDIADSILKYSSKINADITIMMTRQERKFDELFIGSSAKSVVTHSHLPIMTIHPRKK